MSAASTDSRVGRVGILPVQGRLTPVRVQVDRGSRLVVVDDSESEQAIAPVRLLWLGPARAKDATELRAHWEAVEQAAPSFDVSQLWASLRDAGHLQPIAPSTLLARAGEPRPRPERLDALVVALFRDRIHFKLKGGLATPGAPAKIEAAAATAAQRRQEAAEREHVKATIQSWLAGQHPPEGDDVLERYLTAIHDLAVCGKTAPLAQQANATLESVGRRVGPSDRRALALLVELGRLPPYANLAPERAGLRRDYLPDAATLPDSPLRQHAPRDATGLLTVAIDDARTTEVDDAFAVEGDRLLVFIADVGAFVSPGDPIDQEAAKRCATVYLPEGKIPMLPSALGEMAASLRQGEVRPAICFSGIPSADGRLDQFEIAEVLCRVDRQLTYHEADAALASPDDPPDGLTPEVAELLDRTRHWMQAHQAWRARHGAVTFQRNEVALEADPASGDVVLVPGQPNGASRKLISELMVAVGAGTGRFCADRSIPCIFRGQPAPEVPVTAADLACAGPAEQAAALRSFRPSVLSTHPTPHFSLGLQAYTQVTSPLRRYQDLLVHFALKRWLAGETWESGTDDHAKLREAFERLEQTGGVNRRVEADSRRYWTLRYLERHADEPLAAVAVRSLSRRWLVAIPELAFQTTAPLPPSTRPGDGIALRIVGVDARSDVLDLVPA